MKKSDPNFKAALATYCDMMHAGKGAVAALEATGLSHAQADLAWYADPRNGESPVAGKAGTVKLPKLPDKDEPGYEIALKARGLVVAELRSGKHPSFPALSYGMIAVVVGEAETAVRNAFKATGLDSRGTRINSGGRWLGDDPTLYVGNHKGIGVEAARPMAVDRAELRANADRYESVLPKAVANLKKQVSKGVATKARATKKQAPAKQG